MKLIFPIKESDYADIRKKNIITRLFICKHDWGKPYYRFKKHIWSPYRNIGYAQHDLVCVCKRCGKVYNYKRHLDIKLQ